MQFCQIILKTASVQQRATRQIATSEKRGGLVTAFQQFKQKREEFTFVEKKIISSLNFLYLSSMRNFLCKLKYNSSSILRLEEFDE